MGTAISTCKNPQDTVLERKPATRNDAVTATVRSADTAGSIERQSEASVHNSVSSEPLVGDTSNGPSVEEAQEGENAAGRSDAESPGNAKKAVTEAEPATFSKYSDATQVNNKEALEPESKGIPHVKSSATMKIEAAYMEKDVVSLFSSIGPKPEGYIEPPLDISDVEAMEAAAIEIKERIAEEGSITAQASAEIIQQKMKVLQQLWAHFPGAMSSKMVLEGFKKVVEKRGYTPENTLFAQSICPDEVNHEEGDITDLFTSYCGECFHMGGLAGIPFTGKVGFGAFSHHVPDNGHCAVLMAPHIGIDEDGKFGSYSRDGQAHAGSCCGAAVGAYVHCKAGKAIPNLAVNPEFYQFNYIINQVHENMASIHGSTENERQASLARCMHRIASHLLDKCVNVDFGGPQSTLVVLTGIQINMPRPFEDYFLPINFTIVSKDGSTEDVFKEAFGSLPMSKKISKKRPSNSRIQTRTVENRAKSCHPATIGQQG